MTQSDRPTTPPPPAETQALDQFETQIRAESEHRARLAHTLAHYRATHPEDPQ